jgi:hypothetical protein
MNYFRMYLNICFIYTKFVNLVLCLFQMKRVLELCLVLLTQFKGRHHMVMISAGYETLGPILINTYKGFSGAVNLSVLFFIWVEKWLCN